MSPASASSVCALEAKPWPVSCMQVRSMICSQPAVGTASSDAKQPVGTSANLRSCDVEEAKHGGTAVLDLHDLVAAHVTGLDEAERVV